MEQVGREYSSKLFLVLPQTIYNNEDPDLDMVDDYIYSVLDRFKDDIDVEPYIVASYDDMLVEYEEEKDDYPSINSYCKKCYGYDVDENNNIFFAGIGLEFQFSSISGRSEVHFFDFFLVFFYCLLSQLKIAQPHYYL